MLLNLHVKNMAIIDEADADFSEGLNVLSGETGAGKSIIIGSVNLALGGRASSDVIRPGCDDCLIQLTFSYENGSDIEIWLKEQDIPAQDNELIITRRITPSRSSFKINSVLVNSSLVSELSSMLLDIHGQHDNQRLLNKNSHLTILDEYAFKDENTLKDKVKSLYRQYGELGRELEKLDIDEDKKNREISLCEYEINEIGSAMLVPGEDEEVEKEFRLLNSREKIVNSLSECLSLMDSDNASASNLVLHALKNMSQISGMDEDIIQLEDQLLDIQSMISDFSSSADSYLKEINMDDQALYEMQRRLDLINGLKSKYGKTIEEILEYHKKAQERLDVLKNQDELLCKIRSDMEKVLREYDEAAHKLSLERKKAAKGLEKDITKALEELNFNDALFKLDFNEKDRSADGIDECCFMIRTNPGQPLKELAKTGSGGELSRIMLAIKTIMGKRDNIETQIFDEIDTGISGRTAQLVAQKLCLIAGDRQVICITHLPQIASMADTHFLIEKKVKEGITDTVIRKLNEEESIKELARMTAGARITESVLDNAKEMKNMADELKIKLRE